MSLRACLTCLLAVIVLLPIPAAAGAPKLRTVQKPDRVAVFVEDRLFTEYLCLDSEKYPYFFPVNGPRSGQSITTRREKDYPHHSSLFFGCDRVNGGNYWQEGLERGRIVSKSLRVTTVSDEQVVIENQCAWERPGADSPFTDDRRITITAASPDLRRIDFEVTLTARNKVRIEKTNHSLFSGRVAPDLSVRGGGAMVNAQGDSGEKATFGKASPWMDYRGPRAGSHEGLAIFDHPKNRWAPTQWFTRDYGFFSPTPMNWLPQGFVEFAPGEKLHLRYRVLVHAGNPSKEQLNTEYQAWSKD